MIIRQIRLETFAGLQNKDVTFVPGLNVILGANEAGKTTLVNALFAVFFFPSNIRKNSKEWTGAIAKFLPANGGDTISVAVDFSCQQGVNHVLSRSWGETRFCRLSVAGGGTYTNEEAVKEKLATILGLGKGTYESVFFARQEEMIKTVELLRENREAANSLGDALRVALFAAGGVSLEKLAEAIEEAKKDLLSNWDLALDGPFKNRGIDNPYVQNVGRLLKGYYKVETLIRDLRTAQAAEEQIDAAMVELESLSSEKGRLESQLTALEAMEGDLRRRSFLSAELLKSETAADKLKEINLQWPKKMDGLAYLHQQGPVTSTRLEQLEAELREAKIETEANGLREVHRQVLPLNQALQELEEKLARQQAVSANDVLWLDNCTARITRREAELQAMKLVGRLEVEKPLIVKVVSGAGKEEVVAVEQSATFSGDGRLLVSGGDWTLEVQAGQEDVSEILQEVLSLRFELAEKLVFLGVADMGEAKAVLAIKNMLNSELNRLQAQMAGALKERTFAEIATAVAALPPQKLVRATETILTEQAQLKAALTQANEQAEELRRQIKDWVQEYGSHDAVMDRLGDMRSETRSIQAQLALLTQLPAEYGSADEFFLALAALRKQVKALEEMSSRSKDALALAQRQAPDESGEALAEELGNAQHQLQRLKIEAKALGEVEAEFKRVTKQLDEKTFFPFAEAFSRYLPAATGQRYQTAEMEGVLPELIVSVDGKELPLEYLSTGTTRGVALALRLAMGEFLLNNARGFMVMDDPLVDLDPERKEQAAAMVRAYGAERQMIITTCDPETAKLLSGHCIQI